MASGSDRFEIALAAAEPERAAALGELREWVMQRASDFGSVLVDALVALRWRVMPRGLAVQTGDGRVASRAAVHVVRELCLGAPKEVAQLLAPAAITLPGPLREPLVFIPLRGALAELTERWIDTLGDARSDVGVRADDRPARPVLSMLAADRARATHAWTFRRCGCPVCTQRRRAALRADPEAEALRVLIEMELVRHWPGAAITTRDTAWAVVEREHVIDGEPMRQTIELGLRGRELELAARTIAAAPRHDCSHAAELATHRVMNLPRALPRLATWLGRHRVDVFEVLDEIRGDRLDNLRAAGATHDAIQAHAATWFLTVGAALPPDAYRLRTVNGVASYPARDALEAYVADRMRARMSPPCVLFAWRTALSFGPGQPR